MTKIILFSLVVLIAVAASTLNVNVFASHDDHNNDNDCFDDGYETGKDHGFDLDKYEECGGSQGAGNNAYYNGFIAGCLSIQGNTAQDCESATD